MKLYIDQTGVYVGTQVEAKRMGKGWHQVDVPTDKAGLIDYLNALRWSEDQQSTGPVRGIDGPFDMDEAGQPITDVPPPPVRAESYTEKANRFEDEFDAMPLGTQLHYAARAMENARDKL